ncbi:MAG TPA: transporter [Pyrinomonadaceae bacterium]|nr:transporter [Pyrinomonadaceae bacterium]
MKTLPQMVRLLGVCASLCLLAVSVSAQANYEIQVYGSDTVAPGMTMVELHSNFTIKGSKQTGDGTLPTHHAWHETLEVTHGFSEWFETGFYVFTSARSGNGWDWVGSHIRPRVRIPEKWHWPVGLSISNEIGYQRRDYSPNTWTWEIRPIVDKEFKRWYLAFNPTLERALKGPDTKRGVAFSPNFKVGYAFTKKISSGLEYYGALGPISHFDPLREQEQQIVPSIDLNVSPDWEFNFGVGVGMTRNTDHLIAKMIIGRRFSFGHRRQVQGARSKSGQQPDR